MSADSLRERLAGVPGIEEVPELSPGSFDPEDDRQVDAAAGHLLVRFRDHQDVEAFTLLFELTHDRLLVAARSLSRRLSTAVDPEEIVARFMARLFCDVGRRGSVRRFLGLAHTSMRNDVLDELRGRKRAEAKQIGWHRTRTPPAEPHQEIADAEERVALERHGALLLDVAGEAFVRLDRRDQQVLMAREILGLPYARVAVMLDLVEGQVGMIIRRARQHLAAGIRKRLAEQRRGECDPARADDLTRLADRLGPTLDPRGRTRGVGALMQRMLARSADAARTRLADLLYEMSKACLVTRMSVSHRTLVHDVPRRSDLVADDIRLMAVRLQQVNGREQIPVNDVVAHRPQADTALEDAERCLVHLGELEGNSGRRQVALALCRIHAGRPAEGEAILRSLLTSGVALAEITRQNVSRNLTLALLRQERFEAALTEADAGERTWPDDPVRVMNVCFASTRLARSDRFEHATRHLARLQARAPAATVQGWIDGPLRELAHDLNLPPGRLELLLDDAEGNPR